MAKLKNKVNVTIVATKDTGSHQKELLEAGLKLGAKTQIQNLEPADLADLRKIKKKLQGAVVWRSSSLDLASERASLLPILRSKAMASLTLFEMPMARYKFYQQQLLRSTPATTEWSIPTSKFKTKASLLAAIKKGDLAFPVIVKPNAGSRGEGIVLLKSEADVKGVQKISDYIFQNFMENDGDWRVIVVGGAPLGALYRQARPGQFLNNVSQGATASLETRPDVLSQVNRIATKAASLFRLSFGGIDIIRDKHTGAYHVLEINTAPQWRDDFGFRSITGVDVPAEVIRWAIEKESSTQTDLANAVENYYKSRIQYISSEAFHFASRLWLWSGDKWARQILDAEKESYVGTTDTKIQATVDAIIAKSQTGPVSVNQSKSYRSAAYVRHPKISVYNGLLFKVLFCDTVYGMDIRPNVRKRIDDKEFLQAFNELVNDHDAVRLLSTHAINFFYLLRYYFKDKISKSSAVLVAPYELSELLDGYEDLESQGIIDHKTSVKLQIYLLTHAIIGESRFYSRKVSQPSYKALCKQIEQLIISNYFDVSLDNKLEFLVCSNLCHYTSSLESLINQEAEKSISWAGNFLVDTLNSLSFSTTQHCLRTSEHRNVLFLMSRTPFMQKSTGNIKRANPLKITIGRLARVALPDSGIRRAVARVDSGATLSSIDASNIYVDAAQKLHFTLMHPASHLYTGKEIVVDDYTVMKIKNATIKQERFGVNLNIEIDGHKNTVLFTLSDRGQLLYPILLGRNFLTGRYQVDTSRQFVRVAANSPEIQP